MSNFIFDVDAHFPSKRRTSTPPPFDSSICNPNDFLSTPPSSSEGLSQDSASPEDWSNFSWLPSVISMNAPLISGDSWTWNPSPNPSTMNSIPTQPQSINPSALTFTSGPISTSNSYSDTTMSSLDPSFLLPAPILKPSSVASTVVSETNSLYNTPQSSASAAAFDMRDADIADIITNAMSASGVGVANAQYSAQDLVSSFATSKTPMLPLPKPDLAACPPLAKHANGRPAVESSTSSPSSTARSLKSPDLGTTNVLGPSGRPKTSHTTIERRYRTNLNARILMLRRAVPALRVLEKDENQKPSFPEDVIDERGYVDGVRAARKASKASILGKAAEYIHVLKKREHRLRREATGLRMLVSSLVGGNALLNDFDQSWKAQYGGEEADEVADGSDGDDGDDDCSDDDEGPRKKTKFVKPQLAKKEKGQSVLQKVVTTESGKRKRGRPKKVRPDDMSPIDISIENPGSPPSTTTPIYHNINPQYLLGTFLFFSLFKSSDYSFSASQESEHHTHVGRVFVPGNSRLPSVATSNAFNVFLGFFKAHMWLAGSVLLINLMLPWIFRYRRSIHHAQRSRVSFADKHRIKALQDEEKNLNARLHISSFPIELSRTLLHLVWPKEYRQDENQSRNYDRLVNVNMLLGMLVGHKAKFSTILFLYRKAPHSSSKLASLSLMTFPVIPFLARRLWLSASTTTSTDFKLTQLKEKAILRMPLSEAYGMLAQSLERASPASSDSFEACDSIADSLVHAALLSMTRDVFLRSVVELELWSREEGDGHDPLRDDDVREGSRWLSALTSHTSSTRFEVLKWQTLLEDDNLDSFALRYGIHGEGNDIESLINAIYLIKCFRFDRTTQQTLDFGGDGNGSPRSTRRSRLVLSLRKILISSIFSSDSALDDAKDTVIDIICNEG